MILSLMEITIVDCKKHMKSPSKWYMIVTLFHRSTNKPHYRSPFLMDLPLNYLLQDSLLFQTHRLHLNGILSVAVEFLPCFSRIDLKGENLFIKTKNYSVKEQNTLESSLILSLQFYLENQYHHPTELCIRIQWCF